MGTGLRAPKLNNLYYLKWNINVSEGRIAYTTVQKFLGHLENLTWDQLLTFVDIPSRDFGVTGFQVEGVLLPSDFQCSYRRNYTPDLKTFLMCKNVLEVIYHRDSRVRCGSDSAAKSVFSLVNSAVVIALPAFAAECRAAAPVCGAVAVGRPAPIAVDRYFLPLIL